MAKADKSTAQGKKTMVTGLRGGQAQTGAASKTDTVLAKMVDVARAGLADVVPENEIGEHLAVHGEGERLVSHVFACEKPGYTGWVWNVSLARAPRSRKGTVCETSLEPGEGSLLAPAWIPWAQRLQPGDLGREDTLPYVEHDPNLQEGYEATGEENADRLALWELGLGRPRVLSPAGRDQAARRWWRGVRGRASSRQKQTDEYTCSNCGYLLLLAGSLRKNFGVCANGYSPDDGTVVALEHSCGAHSQSDIEKRTSPWKTAQTKVDETLVQPVELEAK